MSLSPFHPLHAFGIVSHTAQQLPMTANPRPISITILACMYIAVGIVGFTYHFREIVALQHNSLWIEFPKSLAIVCGVFMLRVRADCLPPKAITVHGNAPLNAGDIASPVQISSGNNTKITIRYVARCTTLYDRASAASGGPRRNVFAITPRNALQVLCSGPGTSSLRKCPLRNPAIP